MAKHPTEILVSAGDGPAALGAASELGIAVTTAEVRGAGGGALLSLIWNAAHDPFVQGAFLGFLVSRGVVIETKDVDGVRITIKNLKTLQRFLKELIGT
jgi:hypothetical protein